jgi:hypothetical protein
MTCRKKEILILVIGIRKGVKHATWPPDDRPLRCEQPEDIGTPRPVIWRIENFQKDRPSDDIGKPALRRGIVKRTQRPRTECPRTRENFQTNEPPISLYYPPIILPCLADRRCGGIRRPPSATCRRLSPPIETFLTHLANFPCTATTVDGIDQVLRLGDVNPYCTLSV